MNTLLIKKIQRNLEAIDNLGKYHGQDDHSFPREYFKFFKRLKYEENMKILVLLKRTEIHDLVTALLENGWTKEQISSSVSYIRAGSDFVPFFTKKFGISFSRIGDANTFLEEKINMKFDVVIMNPPYQKQVGPKKTEPVWQEFVFKMLDCLKENGHMLAIHPTGWRAPTGRFSKVKEVYLENQLVSLSMNDFNKGNETFGVGTAYDVVLVKKESPKKGLKTLIDSNGEQQTNINLQNLPFIPDSNVDDFIKLLPSNGEEKTELIHSWSAYESRKSWMSNQRGSTNLRPCNSKSDNEHVYPCVYTIPKSGVPRLMYSNTKDNGHFGVPKVIWSNGAATVPLIDSKGEYGLTQFSYAIVGDPENLPKIKKALENEKFLDLMSKVQWQAHKYNYKVISCLKKDWWEDFQ